MKSGIVFLFLSAVLFLSFSCKHEISSEEAQKYYDHVGRITAPFETVHGDVQFKAEALLNRQFMFDDHKAFITDSLQLMKVLADFEAFYHMTVDSLKALPPSADFDSLNTAARMFVDSTTQTLLNGYRNDIFPAYRFTSTTVLKTKEKVKPAMLQAAKRARLQFKLARQLFIQRYGLDIEP